MHCDDHGTDSCRETGKQTKTANFLAVGKVNVPADDSVDKDTKNQTTLNKS
jgi:hypothetical protein